MVQVARIGQPTDVAEPDNRALKAIAAKPAVRKLVDWLDDDSPISFNVSSVESMSHGRSEPPPEPVRLPLGAQVALDEWPKPRLVRPARSPRARGTRRTRRSPARSPGRQDDDPDELAGTLRQLVHVGAQIDEAATERLATYSNGRNRATVARLDGLLGGLFEERRRLRAQLRVALASRVPNTTRSYLDALSTIQLRPHEEPEPPAKAERSLLEREAALWKAGREAGVAPEDLLLAVIAPSRKLRAALGEAA
jgi:hypothetical protein